jgi:hypothetical protein
MARLWVSPTRFNSSFDNTTRFFFEEKGQRFRD